MATKALLRRLALQSTRGLQRNAKSSILSPLCVPVRSEGTDASSVETRRKILLKHQVSIFKFFEVCLVERRADQKAKEAKHRKHRVSEL